MFSNTICCDYSRLIINMLCYASFDTKFCDLRTGKNAEIHKKLLNK